MKDTYKNRYVTLVGTLAGMSCEISNALVYEDVIGGVASKSRMKQTLKLLQEGMKEEMRKGMEVPKDEKTFGQNEYLSPTCTGRLSDSLAFCGPKQGETRED
jgi:hypothetical protein